MLFWKKLEKNQRVLKEREKCRKKSLKERRNERKNEESGLRGKEMSERNKPSDWRGKLTLGQEQMKAEKSGVEGER